MNLFGKYERFCKRNRFLKDDTKATPPSSFISKLVELILPLDRKRTVKGNNFDLPQKKYMPLSIIRDGFKVIDLTKRSNI